jgi:hypothetical protein
VGADPSHPHPVGTWVVHATADGQPFDIHGTLRWIGKPGSGLSIKPWHIVVADVILLGAGLAVFRFRRTARRKRAHLVSDVVEPAVEGVEQPDQVDVARSGAEPVDVPGIRAGSHPGD